METIWNFIIEFYDRITDNTYLIILITSVLMTAFLQCLQYGLGKAVKKGLYIDFGPISMGFTLMAAYLVRYLPLIHPRLKLALSTTSGIIQSSDTYGSAFEKAAGFAIDGGKSIVSYLYFLTPQEQQAWSCNPKELYHSLFRTMDQIRGGWILPDVHLDSSASNFMLIVSVIIIICMFFLLLLEVKCSIYKKIWFLFSSVFLLWLCAESNGSAFCGILMWVTSAVFNRVRKEISS